MERGDPRTAPAKEAEEESTSMTAEERVAYVKGEVDSAFGSGVEDEDSLKKIAQNAMAKVKMSSTKERQAVLAYIKNKAVPEPGGE